MNVLRQLRNFSILVVTTIVLACSSGAVAQTSYKVTDLGREEGENAACAMSVNDEGWTEIMAWNGLPSQNINFIAATFASGRVLIGADVAPTRPKSNEPVNANLLLQRFGLGRIGQ